MYFRVLFLTTFLLTQFPLLNSTGSSSSDRDPPYPNLSCQYCTFKIPDSFKSKYLFCSFYRKDQCGLHSDQFPGHPDAVNSILSVSDNIVMTGCEDGYERAVHLYPHRFLGAWWVTTRGSFASRRWMSVGQGRSSPASATITGEKRCFNQC